jgi:hypothetical protein
MVGMIHNSLSLLSITHFMQIGHFAEVAISPLSTTMPHTWHLFLPIAAIASTVGSNWPLQNSHTFAKLTSTSVSITQRLQQQASGQK